MPEQETEKEVRRFSDWICEQRRGATEFELSEALAEVTAAAIETGKKGSLTFVVNIVPSGDGMVMVHDEVKTKVPEHDRAASLYFADDDGNLTREDPRQVRMEFPSDVHDIREARPSIQK